MNFLLLGCQFWIKLQGRSLEPGYDALGRLMRAKPQNIAIGSGVVLLLLGAFVEIFSGAGVVENNFVTLRFYTDHLGISTMLLGAAVLLIGSLWGQSPSDRSSSRLDRL